MKDLKKWMYKKKSHQFKSQNSKVSRHNLSQKIAFLVDGRSDVNLKTIQKYIKKLQERGKDITLLFLTDHAQPEQISFQAFNKKAFNWFYIPKAQIVLDFIAREFDLLICFNTENVIELNSIMDLSKARFKIGVIAGESDLYHLTINPVKEDTWSDYIGVLERTLDQLSVKPELVYA